MIVKEEFYNVECDCCHELADVDLWSVEEATAKEKALDNDWRAIKRAASIVTLRSM